MGERNKTVKKKRTKQNSKKICFVLHSYPFFNFCILLDFAIVHCLLSDSNPYSVARP